MGLCMVGDRVCWQSQAGGNWKTKEGTVVAVVPAKKDPKLCVPINYRMKKQASGKPRDHESYLVNPDGYGTEVLWPLVKVLRPMSNAVPVNGVLPASASDEQKAVAEARISDSIRACLSCGCNYFPEDLDADGICLDCLEDLEKARETEEVEEAGKAGL